MKKLTKRGAEVWSVLHLTKSFIRRDRRGQMAIAFIVLMALMLVLTPVTMNLGEVARLKTATANSADAGALAGASWVASVTNELALIAQGQLINWWIVQVIFIFPFCIQMIWFAFLMIAVLFIANYLVLKLLAADPVAHAGWDNAHGAALFTAIQNALIDDPTGEVQQQIDQLTDDFEETRVLPPMPVRLEWVRKGNKSFPEPSWVEFTVTFTGEQPELEMGGWTPVFWGWIPGCILFCCFPAFGWSSGSGSNPPASEGTYAVQSAPGPLGALWQTFVRIIPIPRPGSCGYLTCLPFFFSVPGIPIMPEEIDNDEGDVIVTVTQHRQGGSPLRFWKMSYPDQFVSSATAHYEGADVCGPFSACDDAEAELTVVQ